MLGFIHLSWVAYKKDGTLAPLAIDTPMKRKGATITVPVRTYYMDSNIEEPHWGDKVPIDYGHPLSRFFRLSITGAPNAKIWLPKVGEEAIDYGQ